MVYSVLMIFGPTVLYAAVTSPIPSSAAAVQDYPYVALGLIVMLASVVGYFFVRTLRGIDKSQERTVQIQDRLFDKLDALCEDFYTLKGEHKARHGNGEK